MLWTANFLIFSAAKNITAVLIVCYMLLFLIVYFVLVLTCTGTEQPTLCGRCR